MISIRDVLFNEQIFFDEKSDNLISQMFDEMNSLITKIQLLETQAINEEILEDEDDEFENLSMNLKTENQSIENFDKKKDLKLAKTLEETISSTDKTAFHAFLFIEITTGIDD